MRRPLIAVLLGLIAPLAVAAPAAAASADNAMTLHSCAPDRGAQAVVDVSWVSARTATITWKLSDTDADGRAPRLKIQAVDLNGSAADTTVNFFSGGELALSGGRGTTRSQTRTWTPAGIDAFNELQIWVTNGRGSEMASCGWEYSHRMNNYLHSETRLAPTSYAKSRALRDRIVASAYEQMNMGYGERPGNCNKYTDSLTDPNVCRPWCADFAFYNWVQAGVPWAKTFASSYAEDVMAEWRVAFKPVYGSRFPAKGDIAVFRHPEKGKNGHVAVVVDTDGWRVKVIDGNYSDRVISAPRWVDPATNPSEFKPLLGYASPI